MVKEYYEEPPTSITEEEKWRLEKEPYAVFPRSMTIKERIRLEKEYYERHGTPMPEEEIKRLKVKLREIEQRYIYDKEPIFILTETYIPYSMPLCVGIMLVLIGIKQLIRTKVEKERREEE